MITFAIDPALAREAVLSGREIIVEVNVSRYADGSYRPHYRATIGGKSKYPSPMGAGG